MKKSILALGLLSSSIGFFSACQDKAKDPQPVVDSTPLILARSSEDPNKRFLEAKKAKASEQTLQANGWQRPTFEYTIDPLEQRDVKIESILVYKSYRTGKNTFTYHPRVFVEQIPVSQLPTTRSYTSTEIFKDLKVISDSRLNVIDKGDGKTLVNVINGQTAVVFTFEYVAEGGRRIQLTPTTKQVIAGEEVTIVSGTQINTPFAVVAALYD